MTKKDYDLIASSVRVVLEDARNDRAKEHAYAYLGAFARDLAGYIAEDDPSFDRAHFLAECGLEE